MSFELVNLLFNYSRGKDMSVNANNTLLSQEDEIFNSYQFSSVSQMSEKAKCRTIFIVGSYLCKIKDLYSFLYAWKITRTHRHLE